MTTDVSKLPQLKQLLLDVNYDNPIRILSTGGAFSNGILSLTRALGNLSIEGIPTEDDMQAIAEEVVSTSGGVK